MKIVKGRLAYAFLVLTATSIVDSTPESLDLNSAEKHGEETQSLRGVLSPERMSGKTNDREQNAARRLWKRKCCFDGKCREPGGWLSSQNTGMRCMCDQLNTGRWIKCQNIQYVWTTEQVWATEPPERAWTTEPTEQVWTTEPTEQVWITEPTEQVWTTEPRKDCCFNGICRGPGEWLSAKTHKCMCSMRNSGLWAKCEEIEKPTKPSFKWTTEAPAECCVGRTCRQPGQWLTSQGLSCRCDTRNSGRWVKCDEIETTTTTPRSPCYECPRNSRLKSFQCSNTFRDCECRSGFIEDGLLCVAETTTSPSFCGAPCIDDDDCDPDGGCSNCDWKTKVCEPRNGGNQPSNSDPGFTGGFESDRGGLLRLRRGDRLYMAVNDRNGVFFSRSVKQRWEYVDGHLKNKSLGNSHCLTYDNIEDIEVNARLFMRRCKRQDPAEWRVLKINGRRHIQSVSNRLCIDVRNSSGGVATLAKCRSSRADDQAFEDSSFLS